MQRNWLTTGEFARVCHMNKQTLFYYDKIGLLKPAHVGDNGYRYYSFQQVETYNVITVLKEIGMSLEAIRHFLEDPSPTETLRVLEEKERDVERKMKELERTRAVIRNRKAQIRQAVHIDPTAQYVERLPARHVCLGTCNGDEGEKEWTASLMTFIQAITEREVDVGHPIGGFTSLSTIQRGRYGAYDAFYMEVQDVERPDVIGWCPVDVAVAYHDAHYETIGETYDRLFHWMDEQQLHPTTGSFEEYAYDELTMGDSNEALVKVMIPFQRIAEVDE